jgi:hypothetical protein
LAGNASPAALAGNASPAALAGNASPAALAGNASPAAFVGEADTGGLGVAPQVITSQLQMGEAHQTWGVAVPLAGGESEGHRTAPALGGWAGSAYRELIRNRGQAQPQIGTLQPL